MSSSRHCEHKSNRYRDTHRDRYHHDSHQTRRHERYSRSSEGGLRRRERSRSPPRRERQHCVNSAAEKMQDPGFRSMVLEALKERNLLNQKTEDEHSEEGQIKLKSPEMDSKNSTDDVQPTTDPANLMEIDEDVEIPKDIELQEYVVADAELRTPSPDPAVPTIREISAGLHEARMMDNYEFMTNISQGTYGIVYMGKCVKTGAYRAFKRVKKQQKDGRPEAFPLTSLREIHILSSLNHPNIVGLQEVCLSNGRGIIKVMDYAEFDLKRILEMKKDSFAASEVKCIVKQILYALHFLHDHWIMHRDLKPSNILYDSKGNVKLCDFGLARHFGEPLGNYTPLVVTLFYRAPELLLGTETYSPAIDMWSLGCIFAEILLGSPLFQETSEMAMLSKILSTIGEPTDETWPEFSSLPNAKRIKLTSQTDNTLPSMFSSGYAVSGPELLTKEGVKFLCGLLELNPDRRLTAQQALDHEYFKEFPPPCHRRLLPTFVDPKQSKFN